MTATVMTAELPTTRQAAHKLAGCCIQLCHAEPACPGRARAVRQRLLRLCIGTAVLLLREDPTLTLEDAP